VGGLDRALLLGLFVFQNHQPPGDSIFVSKWVHELDLHTVGYRVCVEFAAYVAHFLLKATPLDVLRKGPGMQPGGMT